MISNSPRAMLLTWLHRAGAGLALLLLLTGAYLTWKYRPLSTAAWEDPGARPQGHSWSQRVWQAAHIISAILLPVVLVATLVVTALQQEKFQLSRISPHLLLLLLAGGASVSGVFLPWDQLALWTVSVGENFQGFGWLWSDQVRFVIVDGSVLEPEAVRIALIVHIVLAVAVTGSTIAVALFGRSTKA